MMFAVFSIPFRLTNSGFARVPGSEGRQLRGAEGGSCHGHTDSRSDTSVRSAHGAGDRSLSESVARLDEEGSPELGGVTPTKRQLLPVSAGVFAKGRRTSEDNSSLQHLWTDAPSIVFGETYRKRRACSLERRCCTRHLLIAPKRATGSPCALS